MTDFERKPTERDLFEGLQEAPMELVLRYHENTESRFNNNRDNELEFAEICKILSNEDRTCYFQNQKKYEKPGDSNHKILAPIGEERAIQFIVGLFTEKIDAFSNGYSYKIIKVKEVDFFNPLEKDVEVRICRFRFVGFSEKLGWQSDRFQELYTSVEKLPIPVVDINKEKDRKIWKNYVTALRKLVKQKEEVWKIKKITRPYFQSKNGQDRAAFVDIFIDEANLAQQMERGLLGIFEEEELEDYGASPDKAFIEFKSFRELASKELDELTELGEEHFYELSEDSPIHYLSGLISFKYTNEEEREAVISELEQKLIEDFDLEMEVGERGTVNLSEQEISYLEKVISDRFGDIIELERDSRIKLNVSLRNEERFQALIDKIKARLLEEGIDINRAKFSIDQVNQQIKIEVATYLRPNQFRDEGLDFVKSISILRPGRGFSGNLKPLSGWDIVYDYEKENASKEDIEKAINDLRKLHPNVRFYRAPTLYYFALSRAFILGALRDLKLKVDISGKVEFDIRTSTLRIFPESQADYENQLLGIRKLVPNAVIEDKKFQPTFRLRFKTDEEVERKDILNRIQNRARKDSISIPKFSVYGDFSRLYFEATFSNEEERDELKELFDYAVDPYKNYVNCIFDSPLGRTIYELPKNEKLEEEKERETISNVRRATFIYLTQGQKDKLQEQIRTRGVDENFKGGIQIGTFIKKKGSKLTFKINEEFDQKLTAKADERIELEEIEGGYIKPIFPGELVNIRRMIDAMKRVTEPDRWVGFPANRNLSNFLFDPNEARQTSGDLEEELARVINNLNEPLLRSQAKQLEAVAKSLLAKDLALIQGPPGTGKTTVIAEIIWQTLLQESNSKILITSQTNLAVDNALERLSGRKIVRPLRIGKSEKFEDEGKKYANDRISQWLEADTGSKEEEQNDDNAVTGWIRNIIDNCREEEKYADAVSVWKKGLEQKTKHIKEIFADAYFKYVNVFAATCSECGGINFRTTYQNMFLNNSDNHSGIRFDMVIMDEASKATPPELVLPLTFGEKVVIIGDHKQLPPMIDEREFSEALEAVGARDLIEDWNRNDYKVSQFEKLFKNAPRSIVASLDTQFRMHGQIMECISQFYTDQEELERGLICGIERDMDNPDLKVKASRSHGLRLQPFIEPQHHAIWVNVESPERKVGTSYENEGEVEAIITILRCLKNASGFQEYQDFFKREEDQEIGVITYYMPQMMKLRRTLYNNLSPKDWRNFERHKYQNEFHIPFRINTVDRFQGMERNIIIISTVRSSQQIIQGPDGKETKIRNTKYPFALGFARELQRINVGFSRAKRLLIVVGNQRHFQNKPEYAEAIKKMHRVDIKQLQNLV